MRSLLYPIVAMSTVLLVTLVSWGTLLRREKARLTGKLHAEGKRPIAQGSLYVRHQRVTLKLDPKAKEAFRVWAESLKAVDARLKGEAVPAAEIAEILDKTETGDAPNLVTALHSPEMPPLDEISKFFLAPRGRA